MSNYLTPLIQLQRFFLPALFILTAWAIWRTVFKRDLAVGLALYCGLVIVADGFYNTGIYLPGIAKGSIRYSEVCAVFLFLNRPKSSPIEGLPRLVVFAIGAYFALLFASVFRADSVREALFQFRGDIFPQIVALCLAIRGLKEPADYRRFVMHLTAVVMVIAIFDFWDVFFETWLLHSDSLSTGKYYASRNQGRFGSLFLNPNMLGAFVVLVFPGIFIWTMNERVRLRQAYGALALLLLAFCLVKTQSRGPLMGFSLGTLALAIGPCGGVSRMRRVGFLVIFVVLFAAAMPGFYQTAVERFDKIDEEMTAETARTRETTWIYTNRMIRKSPLLGIGFGEQQFLRAMDAEGFQDEYGEESLDNPHNSYLEMTVFAGLPALLAFLAGSLALVGRGIRLSWQNRAPESTSVVFGLTVGLTGFLFAAYPDMHLFTRDLAPVFWVFFGLLFAVAMRAAPAPAVVADVAVPAPISFVAALQARRRLESQNN